VRVGATGDAAWRFGVTFCTNSHVRERRLWLWLWSGGFRCRLECAAWAEKRMGVLGDFFPFACDCFKYPTSFSVG
jgi:hypothetical protein